MDLEQEIDERMELILSAKDVGPSARKKLKGILAHYAKEKHPFTACVRDNTKRFGKGGAERVCATLKDIIRGTTKWRGHEMKLEAFDGWDAYELDDDVISALDLLTEDDMLELLGLEWSKGADALQSAGYKKADDPARSCSTCSFFDAGTCTKFGVSVSGDMVSDAWEEKTTASLSEEPMIFFAMEDVLNLSVAGNIIEKEIMVEGTWLTSPGSDGKPRSKPLHIVHDGESDVENGRISFRDVIEAYEDGAIENVTIPLSHLDKVDENTGYIRGLKIKVRNDGKRALVGLFDFLDDDIAQKVAKRLIANVSAGLLPGHIRKSDGKRYRVALGHVALTNRPWLSGMTPFGMSEERTYACSVEIDKPVEVKGRLALAQESRRKNVHSDNGRGGDKNMTMIEIDAAELESLKLELEDRRKRDKETNITTVIAGWEKENISPALIDVARDIMLADDGGPAILLSEKGRQVETSATQIVERIMAVVPRVDLSDDPITDKDLEGKPPLEENKEDEELPLEERVKKAREFLYNETGV